MSTKDEIKISSTIIVGIILVTAVVGDSTGRTHLPECETFREKTLRFRYLCPLLGKTREGRKEDV